MMGSAFTRKLELIPSKIPKNRNGISPAYGGARRGAKGLQRRVEVQGKRRCAFKNLKIKRSIYGDESRKGPAVAVVRFAKTC